MAVALINDSSPPQRDTSVAADADEVLSRILLLHHLVTEPTLVKAKRIAGKLNSSLTLVQTLKKMGVIDEEALLDAIRQHGFCLPFGTLLVELGYIGPKELRQLLLVQAEQEEPQKLGELLVDRQLVSEADTTRLLSAHMGLTAEEPILSECDHKLLIKVPIKTMAQLEFFPIRTEDDRVHVAFTDPINQTARTEAARLFLSEIVPVITSPSTFKRFIVLMQRYKEIGTTRDSKTDIPTGVPAQVYKILQSAIRHRASDIHIEPMENRVRVRFRVDGVLREHAEIGTKDLSAIVSRLKIESGADIGERRRHQDGRIKFVDRNSALETDLRVSFYVTIHGESVVLRILNRSESLPKLPEMGIPPLTLARFEQQALETPSGVIIITGPTGSGKTTTLYSCVNQLNDDNTSIITAEEPVEYTIDGISQCSLNPKIGRTFDESLRHIVRQDPDIIVLGEVRDRHSAECAIQAALTGHKVLTTFHTEDSVGGLLRLINMNIEAFLIASSVTCIVAQRLIRKICPSCSKVVSTDQKTLRVLGWEHDDISDIEFRGGEGCVDCQFTGFKGRIPIFEPLILNKSIRDAILENAPASELRRVSSESAHLVTLLEDGLTKAVLGLTTLGEVRRTLPRVQDPRGLNDLRRLTGIQL